MVLGTIDVLENELKNVTKEIENLGNVGIRSGRITKLNIYKRRLQNRIHELHHGSKPRPMINDNHGFYIV